jgi:hypothetical protein
MFKFLVGYLIERALLRLAIRIAVPAALLAWMLGGCGAIDAALRDLCRRCSCRSTQTSPG